jgi:hypothetical protein
MSKRFVGMGKSNIQNLWNNYERVRGVIQEEFEKSYHRIVVEQQDSGELLILYVNYFTGLANTSAIQIDTALYGETDFEIREKGLLKRIKVTEEPIKVTKTSLSEYELEKSINNKSTKELNLYMHIAKTIQEPVTDFIIVYADGEYNKKLKNSNKKINIERETCIALDMCMHDNPRFKYGIKCLRESSLGEFKKAKEQYGENHIIYQRLLSRREYEKKNIKEEFRIYPNTLP